MQKRKREDETMSKLRQTKSQMSNDERFMNVDVQNPLTKAGKKVMASMRKKYGKRAREVFYRSINARVPGSSKWHQ